MFQSPIGVHDARIDISMSSVSVALRLVSPALTREAKATSSAAEEMVTSSARVLLARPQAKARRISSLCFMLFVLVCLVC